MDQIDALITAALEVTAEVSRDLGPHPRHLATLLGQRRWGSQWGKWVPQKPEDYLEPPWLEMPEVPSPQGQRIGCRYLRCDDAKYLEGAVQAMATWCDLTDELRRQVIAGMTDHGYSLFLPPGMVSPKCPAQEMWLILGPVDEDRDRRLMIYTAYPGWLSPDLPTGFKPEDVATLDPTVPYAVKQRLDPSVRSVVKH